MARRRHCSDVVGERQLVQHEAQDVRRQPRGSAPPPRAPPRGLLASPAPLTPARREAERDRRVALRRLLSERADADVRSNRQLAPGHAAHDSLLLQHNGAPPRHSHSANCTLQSPHVIDHTTQSSIVPTMPKHLCIRTVRAPRASPHTIFLCRAGHPPARRPGTVCHSRAALTHLRRTFRDAVGPYGAHTTARRRCRLRAVDPLDDQRRHELRRHRLRRRQRARALHPRSLMQPTQLHLT